jgi:hypothetical protein
MMDRDENMCFLFQQRDIFIKLDFGKFSVNKGVLPFPTFLTVEKRKKKKEKRGRRKEEKKETSKNGNRNTLQWTIHHDPLQGEAFSVGGVAVLIPKDSTCTPLPAPTPTCRFLCNRNQL